MENTSKLESEEERLDWEVETMWLQLHDLRVEMRGLQDRAREGDLSASKDAMTAIRSLRDFLNSAQAMEAKLDDYKRRRNGGEGRHVLDLEGARTSIRCRLDRLRRCGDPG